jgi:chromosomal replication initiator protein
MKELTTAQLAAFNPQVASDLQGSTPLAVISDRVVRDFRLRSDDLQSRTREQRISFARQLAMFLCRKMTGAPFESIGEHFNRGHSTVIHAVNLIERRIRREAAFRLFIEKLEGQITGTIPPITAAAA